MEKIKNLVGTNLTEVIGSNEYKRGALLLFLINKKEEKNESIRCIIRKD